MKFYPILIIYMQIEGQHTQNNKQNQVALLLWIVFTFIQLLTFHYFINMKARRQTSQTSIDHKKLSVQSLFNSKILQARVTDTSQAFGLKKDQFNNSSQFYSPDKFARSTEKFLVLSNYQQITDRLMELEGQCKIKQWEYLKFNIIQAVLVMIVLVITVFGLFALKYSVWFRKMVLFSETTADQATHIFITGNDRKHDIVKILDPGKSPLYFNFKKLKYSISRINSEKPIPVGYQFQKQFSQCFSLDRIKNGLKSQQILKRRQLYGFNQHLVETPHYFQYLLDVMTEPFFLLQYFFCFIFFIQGYSAFSFALLAFSFITTTINYIMLYISYRKIKKMAEKQIEVSVMRNGKAQKINSRQLVPGDIYIPEPQQEIPADCMVGFGDIYVNQANLTGQSFPIGKFKIQDLSDINNSNVWIFEGSKVLETKADNTYAVVINTGFTTHRGRIIRKILNRTVKDPDIIRTTLIFVLQVVIVSFITFFVIMHLMLKDEIDKLFVFFKFIDFLASAAPPPLPIFFNLAYSFSLLRLGYLGITGTEPQKTVDGAQVKTFCFDKTGTLTKNDVSISKIFKIRDQKSLNFHNIIAEMGQNQNELIWKLFATCHTTKLINNELLGDQIDKQMFAFINASIENTNDPNIRFIVKSTKNFTKQADKNQIEVGKQEEDQIQLERKRQSLLRMKNQHNLCVLRINQFESKFQQMSVLVKDTLNKKHYIFAKGSPQKILSNSSNIAPNSQSYLNYTKMIKTLSLNGFRTIGMSYKQLKNTQQIEYYLKADRDKFLHGLINLGLIAFQNRLKLDTWITINKLVKSNVQTKMITGDNIYIAVQTARRCGIIGEQDRVVFLEGGRNIVKSVMVKEEEGQFSRVFQGTIIDKVKEDMQQSQNTNFVEQVIQIHEKNDYLKGQYIFAVDNNFLTMDPPPLLSHNIKVFSRIPPQNKAYIIRQYKKQHNEYIRTHYSKFTRWLKTKTWKIGMCGDGANDLLALRQADLSVGIQATDASYGSSFTVKNMLDVDWIIKESRCTQANIIVLYQFYGSISMFILICSIIMITDFTYFSTPQLMYLNFGTILNIPGTLAMSRPFGQQTQFVPDANMMGLHNHLMFWGNLIIPFAGILGAWFFFSKSAQFIPNPKAVISLSSGGFNSKNQCTTLIFILVILTAVCNGFMMYRSKPWRERFWNNYLFTLLMIANITIALAFAFLTSQLEQPMQFQPISKANMGICIGIMFGALAINYIFNLIVSYFKLDHKTIVLEKQEAQLASYIRKNGPAMIKDSTILKNLGKEQKRVEEMPK